MRISPPFLSVVIPIFNESKRAKNIPKFVSYLKNQSFDYELILVNDGSFDDTDEILKKLQKKHTFNLISYKKNKGKGFAIKMGMLEAKGQYRLFSDVDLSTPISEFKKFEPYLKSHDIIIATRKNKHAKLRLRQPKLRENLGKAFTLLSQKILSLELTDFTCGFKSFSKSSATQIFRKSTINRWGFDAEILYIAKKLNLSLIEVPVIWKNDPGTKVRFPQDIYNSLYELVKIKLNDAKRKY